MKQKYLTMLLSVLMSMVGAKAFAHDIEVKNADGVTIYYNFINDGTELEVTYLGDGNLLYTDNYVGNVAIPESVTYNGKTYSVTSIGVIAFSKCSGLTEVTIPNSVTSIDMRAFSNCSGLEKIVVDSNNFYYDSREDCNAVIRKDGNVLVIGCKNTLIPSSVTSIGEGAFFGCIGLTELTIPTSVTSIGNNAFYGCSGLTELTIPNSVTSIDDNAFSSCSGLEKIVVDIDNPYYDSREGCNAVIRKDGNVLVVGCKNTLIPSSVISIGDGAFYGCSGLTELNIPSSVTSIGKIAFYWCSGLTELTIPSSVTSIGNSTFYGCIGLTKLTIPNSVTSIDNNAFYGCTGLTELSIPNSVIFIGVCAFSDCSGLEKIVVDSDNPYYDSRENCNAVICKAGNMLVVGCKNTLIPNSVTSIGYSAFSNCSGLTELTIPNSVTSIGDWAFYGCSGLTELTIPNSVTSIGDEAFAWCSGLTELTIGNGVTSIGYAAFVGCRDLTSITSLNTTPPHIDYDNPAFDSTTEENATLHVPAGCKEAYQQAEYWKNFLNIQDDASTGIESIRTDKQDNTTVYTLDGKQLNTTNIADLPTGIYIINGKKVAVK